MGYVGWELVKLGMELGRLRSKNVEGEKVLGAGEGEKDVQLVEHTTALEEKKRAADEEWSAWYRRFGVNVAYAPMSVHYSVEDGPLGEGSIAALGVIVAWLTFGKVWKETA